MKKMYIVRYFGGSYDDWYEANVFVTDKKATATKYVTKFNKMLSFYENGYTYQMDIVQNVSGRKIQYVKLSPIDSDSEIKYVL